MKLSKEAEDHAKKVIQNRCQRLLSNLEEDLRHNLAIRQKPEINYVKCVNEMAKVIVDTYKQVYKTSQTRLDLEDVEGIVAEINRIGSEAVQDFATSQVTDGVDLIVQVFREDLTLEIEEANLERQIDEDRKMKEQQLIETEKRRYQLLKKIFDETKASSLNVISLDQPRKDEQLTEDEFYTLTEYLKNEGLVKYPTMGTITITHDGVKEIEASIKDPDKGTDHFTRTVIQNFFHGTVYGVQAGGSHNTQNVQVNIHPDFNENLSKLMELIKNSPLSELEKEEATEALQRLPKLAEKEKSADVIEAATKRLNLLMLAIM